MLLIPLKRPGVDEDIVKIGEAEFESPQNVVHEALKSLDGVAQAE